jgi:hypothetical protein
MAAILAVLVASIITSLGMTGPAEHAAEGAIRQRLGKVERVNVHIDRGHRSPFSRTVPEIRVEVKGFSLRGEAGSPMRVTGSSRMNGEVSKIVVAAEDFEVEGLQVARMDATIRSVRYDLYRAMLARRLRLTGLGESTVAVRLTGPALQRYVAPRVTVLRDFRLRLLHGRIEVSGRTRSVIPVPVTIVAGLEVKNRAEIHLSDPHIRVTAVPLPGFLVRRIMSQVNPVCDLSRGRDQALAIEIDQLRVAPSGLLARGRVRPA